MTAQVTEYIVLDYIDDLEEALSLATDRGMKEIVTRIDELHGDFIEMGNLIDSIDKASHIQQILEVPLKEMLRFCQDGNSGKALEVAAVLKSSASTIIKQWT